MDATITAVAVAVADRLAPLRETFAQGVTRPLAWRRRQLRSLLAALERHEQRILETLAEDLGKPALEAYASEVGYLKSEIKHALRSLRRWARPKRVPTPLHSQPGISEIRPEPLGVVLIVGPWNYPFQLVLAPLVGALAAGNCAVIKPSELAPATSRLLVELLGEALDPAAVQVVEGGVPETQALLAAEFDHIFFTGSARVGRIVAEAAAKRLTPVTLELGGKSPCIVDAQVDLTVAARRIVWGKFFNAGQTCVAPDYLLVHEQIAPALEERLLSTIREFYGEDPRRSPDYARIVSRSHLERLLGLLAGQEVVTGGEHDLAERYLAPTLLRGVAPDSPLMQEEIFGPILPLLTVPDLDAAVEFVRARPKPLALYVFSAVRQRAERVLARTSSGGACVNDTLAHLAVAELPFGGVGQSGYGAYHGRYSFETFSHRKSVLRRATWLDVAMRYPPYAGLGWVKRLVG